MALRNALGGLALDDSLVQLLLAAQREYRAHESRTIPYARDSGDRMRAVTDATSTMTLSGINTGTAGSVATHWGLRDTYPTWYNTGSPSSMDAREQQRALQRQNFYTQRARWTIT